MKPEIVTTPARLAAFFSFLVLPLLLFGCTRSPGDAVGAATTAESIVLDDAGKLACAFGAVPARLALDRSPNRFYSVFGAGRAAKLGGDIASVTKYYRLLLDNCADGNDDRPELKHAREYLG